MVHEGTKRPSCSSVARRIPNIWSNSENTTRSQKRTKIKESTDLMTQFKNANIAVMTTTQSHEVSTSFQGKKNFACLIYVEEREEQQS